jgi:hypothetical protein
MIHYLHDSNIAISLHLFHPFEVPDGGNGRVNHKKDTFGRQQRRTGNIRPLACNSFLQLRVKACMKPLTILALIVATVFNSQAQEKAFRLVRTSEPVHIDGALDDPAWGASDKATGFWMNAPLDNQPAQRQTEVFGLYDDKNIYIAARLFGPTDFVIQSLKRDSDPESSDSFGVLLDPIGQRNLGYSFAVNAGGAQTEAMVSAAQGAFVRAVDESWDVRWYSAVTQLSDGWAVEMAIPLKSVRFKEGKATWNVNFWRIDRQANERHSWVPVPLQFTPANLGFTGSMQWAAAPPKNGLNMSVTPYTLAAASNDYTDSQSTRLTTKVGGEAKVGLTPSLNLDITTNPDFSQTDVDQQITNLSRFNIFFPERRQFFLENADVFTNFGAFPDAPFFSRRIGLSPAGQQVPILYGVRLTGNLDPRLRVGALNMQTRETTGQTAQNYSALALHRRVLTRSSIRGLFLNRQAVGEDEQTPDYGRNATGEFEYLSTDNRWTGKLSYSQSMTPGNPADPYYAIASAGYNGRQFQATVEAQKMGTGYRADMGFLSRLNNYDPASDQYVPMGYTYVGGIFDYSVYPTGKQIIRHWLGTENYTWWLNSGVFNEWYNRMRYFIFFRNTSQLRFRFNSNSLELLFPFQLTNGSPLPTGRYAFHEGNLQFNTDLRRRLNYEFFGVYGSFYSGYKTTIRSAANLRCQPWGNFSLGFEWNDIRLPAPYGREQLWLINPKTEINFSNSLFWTTFFQFNTQLQNFNINSRLQWRYRPMSDLFIVYSDNYDTHLPLGSKNRTLVVKLNYYFQL